MTSPGDPAAHDIPQMPTRGPGRPGRPGHDAASVIAVATRVFTERGYNGTSMDDVARELGVTKSAIYHHVSSKEDILRGALDRALAALEAVMAQAQRDEVSAGLRLERVVRESVQVLDSELESVTLLLRVRGNTVVERDAMERRRRIDTAFADLVRSAQETGEVRADVDPAIMARLIFGTVNSITEWYRPRGSEEPVPHNSDSADQHANILADQVCALIFGGLHPRP